VEKIFHFVVTPVKTGVKAILNGSKSRSERDWIPAPAPIQGSPE
jgi:hypothetical protein